ncbi:MAG TPA: Uma2 family endonuclease [Candidatus Nanopelagicales bacterium]|nr:Uma2 family endonuclease [Candidatus Nanopelagicales bacterium]
MTVAAKAVPASEPEGIEPPDVSAIVTEDDTPVDNFASEKQQRLLTEPLYTAWSGPPPDEEGKPRGFVAAANVGLFATPKEPAIVPDAFLSLDVQLAEDLWKKENRTYFFWEMGKPPDVVIEVVSNREGNELAGKLRRYARMRITHYVVWDPQGIHGEPRLRVFELRGDLYMAMERPVFRSVGLGLVLWEGTYEGLQTVWLRWALPDGTLIPTGAERADAERLRAEAEHTRAEAAQARAEAAQARAERLAEKLRAHGVDPNGDS